MSSLQVPILKINEVEENQPIVFSNTIKTAFLIPSTTGEGNIPFLINKMENLVDNIPLTTLNEKYWWQAWNYLQYNNDGAYIIRPVKLTDVNYYNSFNGSTITTSYQSDLYNSDVAQGLLYDNNLLGASESLRVYNKYVNNNDNIAVLICEDENNWTNSISDESIGVVRDVERYDYNDLNENLNNTYLVTTQKITSNYSKFKTDAGTPENYINFDENLSHIEVGQYLTGLTIFTTEVLVVDDITNNIYREVFISAVDTGTKTLTLAGYHGYLRANEYITMLDYSTEPLKIVTVTPSADGTTTDIVLDAIQVDSRNITTTDIAVIESETTTIYTETDIETELFVIVRWLYGDWNAFINTDIVDGTILTYDFDTDTWEEDTLTYEKNYYIYNLDKVYYFNAFNDISISTLTAEYLDSTLAILNLYSSDFYNIDGTIKSFYEIFLTNPVWEDDEYGMLVLVKNITTGLFELGERYILDYTQGSDNLVFNNSKNIYLKSNVSYGSKASTNGKSINDCIIADTAVDNDYDDIERYIYSDLYNSIYSIEDSNIYNIEYLCGFRYKDDNDLYSFNLSSILADSREDILCIQSLWNENDYIGKLASTIKQNLLNTFGINGSPPKQFTKNSTYTAIFGNMKLQYDIYNKKNIWVPISGDVAGIFVENSVTDISAVGMNLPIKNAIRLLFNLSSEADRKILNLNGINSIVYNNLKQPVIFDSITSTKNLYMITRELHKRRWSNKIKIWFKDNFFSQLLKILSNTSVSLFRDKLKSYCTTLNELGVIQKNFVINIYTEDSTTVVIDLQITFNDIIRKIIFNIRLQGSEIKISELER